MDYIYGKHPVLEAFEGELSVEKVFLLEGTHGELEKEMRHACKKAGVPMLFVPRERLNILTKNANHQGVVALVSSVTYHTLEEVHSSVLERGEVPLYLLLDGITDVRNIGAIARTAEGAGAHALIVPQKGTATLNAEAMKASAGALALLPVCRVTSLSVAMDFLGENDVQIAAAALRAEHTLYDVPLVEGTALMLGAEGTGVQRHHLFRADVQFTIPMIGQTDSFNVSVAAGMMLYETTKQRIAAGVVKPR